MTLTGRDGSNPSTGGTGSERQSFPRTQAGGGFERATASAPGLADESAWRGRNTPTIVG